MDFVCFSAKLVIELDGESHDFAEWQAKDVKRDEFFATEGFTVLRFTNAQVISNLEGVVEAIRQVIVDRACGHKGGGSGESFAGGQDDTTGASTGKSQP
ncbi:MULTISPECIES: endonuclease domain-containing protein [unclassified Bradyrhizobium]|uniref:endonuclease domain-containing protein n=1 Tax=unclassified Bradyrhizobium TaxID=2631580 RepID=UPI0028E82127|nr:MULTISPECIES: endonuclease domain-containing protein [unclassified Bradyrhizobium]